MMKRLGTLSGHGCAPAFLYVLFLWIVSAVQAFPGLAGGNSKHVNLLMVGNSFSEAHNMEEMIQYMLNERKMILQADSIFAARFDQGGANLKLYSESEQLANMISERPWKWVVLQEQSETPGFYNPSFHEDTYNNSLAAVLDLDRKIQENGATTILFETWGYFERDPINADFYTDYQTMQDRITRGYEIYRENILKNNPNAKVKIAPAGLAFNRIFKNIQNDQGKDPFEKGSLFDLLYDPDEGGDEPRKHPTLMGSYLCGCVLFQTLTGLDVRQSSFTPSGMDVKIRDILQKAAYDTVVEYLGTKPASAPNPWYSLPTTPAPYIPSDSRSGNSNGTATSFAPGRWFLAVVILVGVGMFVWSRKRNEAPRHPRQLNLSWDLLPTGDPTMELTDMPGGFDGDHRQTLL